MKAAVTHNNSQRNSTVLRFDWDKSDIEALFELPFNDLLYQAQQAHRAYFDPNEVQVSTLLSIKTGRCPWRS